MEENSGIPLRLVEEGSFTIIPDIECGERQIIYDILEPEMSYAEPGAIWSPAYKSGNWDGRIRLLRRLPRKGISFPSGFLSRIIPRLRVSGYDPIVEDARPAPVSLPRAEWRGSPLRPYQVEAVEALSAVEGGILRLPMRAGKTLTAARLIWELRLRTLFVVTSDLLLAQAARAFEKAMPSIRVTCLGDGDRDVTGEIVVATAQSLGAADPKWFSDRIADKFSLLICDEVHHLDGKGHHWRNTMLGIKARRRYGLSATVEIQRGKNIKDPGSIWLEGITGPIIYSKSIEDMVDGGWLVPPIVYFRRHQTEFIRGKWTPQTYSDAIVKCASRNEVIVAEACRWARRGSRVLVDVGRVGHGRLLAKAIREELGPQQVVLLVGSSSDEERAQALEKYERGDLKAIVGTIMGEGIDIPSLEVVINAEGGMAETAGMQRLRNLTTTKDKKRAIVVELVDTHHVKLRKWTEERYKMYKSQSSFDVRVEKKCLEISHQ